MRKYFWFIAKRFGQFILVVFLGISVIFVIARLRPIDPAAVTMATAGTFGHTNPEAMALLRRSLGRLYGQEGSIWQQYLTFWRCVLHGDFGPSVAAFPTPVAALIGRSLPWTAGLLAVSTLIAWGGGSLFGGLAGYDRDNPWLRVAGWAAMAIQPIPYYIAAFVLLILFGYVWPVFPPDGGGRLNLRGPWTLAFLLEVVRHAALPALSLVVATLGMWFASMRALTAAIVSEDYVSYAEVAGVPPRRIFRSYVMRNALAPQLTALAMSLGSVFGGTAIIEAVYGYPGIGKLLLDGVSASDYGLVLGVAAVAIVVAAGAAFIVALFCPLFDPRRRWS